MEEKHENTRNTIIEASQRLRNYKKDKTETNENVLLDSFKLLQRLKIELTTELDELSNKIKDIKYGSEEYKILKDQDDKIFNLLTETKDLTRNIKRNLLQEFPALHKVERLPGEFFTKGQHGRQILEIESALGDLYRFLINDHAPIMRTKVNPNTKLREYVDSKAIPGYEAFSEYTEKQNELTGESEFIYDILDNDKLIKGGIAKVLVAAYVLEEVDLHWGNIGTDENGNVVKIDHDHSAWSWTKKYFEPYNTDNVIIDCRDIESFPVLTYADPGAWVGRPINGDRPNDAPGRAAHLSEIGNNPDFQREKWLYFVKVLLIDKNLLQGIAHDHFSSQNGEQKFVNLFVNRFAELKNELLKIPAFREYVLNTKDLFESLVPDFEKYNQEFKNTKHENRCIDINLLRNNFEEIKENVKSADLEITNKNITPPTGRLVSSSNIHPYTEAQDINKAELENHQKKDANAEQGRYKSEVAKLREEGEQKEDDEEDRHRQVV